MQLIENPDPSIWGSLIKRPLKAQATLESAVKQIIAEVQKNGDQALKNYTSLFDGVRNVQLTYQIEKQEQPLSDALKAAIQTAYANIEKFHKSQQEPTDWVETMPGVSCCRRSTPIERVGLYIPGGTAPLFSSLLMLAIPAIIANCKSIVVCTPPQPDGTIHPALIYTAQLLGLAKVHAVGGAQAIAAMAYGTESIAKVYKILGPGNQYVTMAKQLVSKDVAIDFPAGPSEVAILADAHADANFIAADLLSQAEHGADSQVVLATNSARILEEVKEALEQQLADLPRRDVARQALSQSKLVLFDNLNTAMEFLNTYAPEHLLLNVEQPDQWAEKVINAGSVFMGAYSPESAGDYASGTNHTLPTNGNALMYAGVSLDTFVKKITFQKITAAGLEQLGDAVENMASAEGLEAHRRAVSIRRKSLKNSYE